MSSDLAQRTLAIALGPIDLEGIERLHTYLEDGGLLALCGKIIDDDGVP